MNVMILIPRLEACERVAVGGAERNIVNLANALTKNGISVLILIVEDGGSDYCLDSRVELKTLGMNIEGDSVFSQRMSALKYLSAAAEKAGGYVESFGPDIVLSFLTKADAVAYILKKRFGDRILWVASERNDPTKTDRAVRLMKKYIYKKADLLVCQTRFARAYYRKIANKKILPNILDISILPEPADEIRPDGMLNIVSAGRLDEQKNYSMLIRAVAAARDDFIYPVRLSIYGRGPLEERLKEETGNLNVEDIVCFPGFVEDWHEEIKTASIYIISSDHEGVSNSLYEAVLMGIPVITTDVAFGDTGNIVDEKAGIIVAPGDETAMKNAMISLVNDEHRRREMRDHNRKLRTEKENGDRSAAEWIETFESLIREHRQTV